MLQKSSTFSVLEQFFNEPTKQHYLMELARAIPLAHTSVSRILKELEKEKIINKKLQVKNSRTFPVYQANINLEKYKQYKKIHNLQSIFESGLIQTIQSQVFSETTVLFGSYSRGEDTETSDIDIFIQGKEKNINTQKFEKLLHRKIQIHFAKNITKLPKELQLNIINGILLDGFLDLPLDKHS